MDGDEIVTTLSPPEPSGLVWTIPTTVLFIQYYKQNNRILVNKYSM